MATVQPFEIAKLDAAERLVFGFANVSVTKAGGELVDLQNDVIPVDVLEKAAYDFVLHSRDSGEMHRPDARGAGTLVESFMITPEKLEALGLAKDAVQPRWWVGFKLNDAAFAKVQSGEYKMFSVQGKAIIEETEVDA